MSANALVQTRIDPEIKEQAAKVLENIGLTVSDAIRMLLTRTANEGVLPFSVTTDPLEYDIWFRERVQEALDDPHPGYSEEEVEAHFARRRSQAANRARSTAA